MGKNFTAIASVSSGDPEKPITSTTDPKEALAKMKAFLAEHDAGYVLAGADLANVQDWLAAIGCEEVSVSEDGALEGEGTISYEAEGCGLGVKVDSKLSCKGVWDHARMQWQCAMDVQKTKGEEKAYALNFTFASASFGLDSEGQAKLLYNYSYERDCEGDERVRDFNNGKQTGASKIEISSNTQWGYFLMTECGIVTGQGTLLV